MLPVRFGSPRRFGSGDKISLSRFSFSLSRVLTRPLDKGSFDFMGGSSLWYITTLTRLLTTEILKVLRDLNLSRDFT